MSIESRVDAGRFNPSGVIVIAYDNALYGMWERFSTGKDSIIATGQRAPEKMTICLACACKAMLFGVTSAR